MAMHLRQQIKMSQTLRMTPQLQQAIRLLQLSRMELIDEIRSEMTENPLLEEGPSFDVEPPKEVKKKESETADCGEFESAPLEDFKVEEPNLDKIDWEKFMENYNSPTPGNSYKNLGQDELPTLEQTLSTSESLTEHLIEQVRFSGMNDEEQEIAALIIGNLDETGYLRNTSVEELAFDSGQDPEDVSFVLEIVQSFDPLGVAARNLKECLLIQAAVVFPKDEVVRIMIEDHIPSLERKSFKKIAKEMDLEIEVVFSGAQAIAELEPKPGREFAGSDARYITPDIYIYKVGNEYVTTLNEDGMPKLRISNYYKEELARKKAEGEKDEARSFIQDKLRGAMWLIRSIHQRQSTIKKVTQSIIKFQHDFFEEGVEHLKPLVLKDIANDIDMHESTVSRVTTNKYVHTPRGTFELKYFFNSSITNREGADLASEAVKAKIREIISNEEPKKPLSDAKIVKMLSEDGVEIARRTVAKYREMMGILSSAKRKQLF